MTMTTPSFSGAVDLGALAAKKQAAQNPGTKSEFVIDVTTADFQSRVLELSHRVPVVIDVWATWCGPCKQLSPILEDLATEFQGRLVIAKVDADAEPQISSALQVQSIPSVFAAINGQLIPLFQGAYPKEQVRQIFDKLLELAAEQGLTPESVSGGESPEVVAEVEEPVDPRFDAAVAALDAGDWDTAKAEYQAILDSNPADLDAQGGLIMTEVFHRTEGKVMPTGNSYEDLLLSADLAAASGDWVSAFESIIAAVKASGGAERELARDRAVSYFLLAGELPEVAKARISLANALY